MGFRSASRTVDELAKGLIRSDEVAISELTKTAVAAGSRQVEIAVNVCLKDTHYRQALIQIREDGQNAADVVDFIARSSAHQKHRDSLTIVERLERTHSDPAFLLAGHSSHSMVIKGLLKVIALLVGQMNPLSLETYGQDRRSNREHLSRIVY